MRPKADPVGNPRSSEAPPPVPVQNLLEAAVPDPPDNLEERGLEVWENLWAAGAGAYHGPTDRYVIERYCQLHDRRQALMEVLERDGFMILGSQGQDVLHPASRALDTVEKELRALEDRLGLNPESRARLSLAVIEHKSKLDAFLEEEGLD